MIASYKLLKNFNRNLAEWLVKVTMSKW